MRGKASVIVTFHLNIMFFFFFELYRMHFVELKKPTNSCKQYSNRSDNKLFHFATIYVVSVFIVIIGYVTYNEQCTGRFISYAMFKLQLEDFRNTRYKLFLVQIYFFCKSQSLNSSLSL